MFLNLQRDEILNSCVQGPPNKTICNLPEWAASDKHVPDQYKSSSAGQLGSWVKWNSSSGKSPPAHKGSSRGQRQPHLSKAAGSSSSSPIRSSSKHKGSASSSSSACSSTSSSTSSFSGAANTPSKGEPSGGMQGFAEKLHTVFSQSAGNRTSPNNNSAPLSGVFSNFFKEETRQRTKSCSKGSRGSTKNSDYCETANQSSPRNVANASSVDSLSNSKASNVGPPVTRRSQSDGLFVMVAKQPSSGAGVDSTTPSKNFQLSSEEWNYTKDSTSKKLPLLSSTSALESELAVSESRHFYNVSPSSSENINQQWDSPNSLVGREGQEDFHNQIPSDCRKKKSTTTLTSDNLNHQKKKSDDSSSSSKVVTISSSSLPSSLSPLLEASTSNDLSSCRRQSDSSSNDDDSDVESSATPNNSSFPFINT